MQKYIIFFKCLKKLFSYFINCPIAGVVKGWPLFTAVTFLQ